MSEEKKELVREAEALGIDVDGRWGVDTLQEKIKEREAVLAAQDGEADGDAETDGEGESEAVGSPAGGPAAEQAPAANGSGLADGLDPVDQSVADGALVRPEDGQADAGTDGEGAPTEGGADVAPDDLVSGGDRDGSGGAAGEGLLGALPAEPAGAVEESPAGDAAQGAVALQPVSAPEGEPSEAEPSTDVEEGSGEPEPAFPEAPSNPVLGGGDVPDHGDGSADGAATSGNRSFDEVREAVLALTMPLQSAFDCASAVYEKMTERQDPEPLNYLAWFCLDDSTNTIIALVSHAAPFVRSWPEAPVEALYGHVVSGGGVNLVLERPWADLPVEKRIAWTVFRDTLVTIDKALKAEWKAETPERVSRLVPIDETTLEEVDEPFATSEFAR